MSIQKGRPTYAYVDLKALDHNLGQVRARAGGRKVLAVVKADAYGHGAVEVARRLEASGVDMLGVALVEEGAKLREAGIHTPILVLGGVFGYQVAELLALDLTPVLFDKAQAEAFSNVAKQAGRRLPVHVKIDTGMGRIGAMMEVAVGLINAIKAMPGLEVEGIMTHLSEADALDKSFAEHQVSRFNLLMEELELLGIKAPLVHAAGSAAIIDFGPALFNMVRPGIMLYGYYPSPHMRDMVDLRPVLSLKSRVLHVKEMQKGLPVSYGRTFVTGRTSLIATLPIGYADGLSRGLSNKGEVLIRGRKCPIVGRVCMDMMMVDVTEAGDVRFGDEAVIIGRQNEAEVSAEDIAGILGTISYEVLCNVSARVPRVYLY